MEMEPQVSFRNVERNDGLDRMIQDGIAKLDSVHERITGLRLAVEDQRGVGTPDHLYRVRIDITVPGREIVIREGPTGGLHPPLDQVLGRAFETARRRLRETRVQRKGKMKAHASPPWKDH